MFKVKRSFPAPASLASRRSYSKSDVLETLNRDFLSKCYICETRDPISLNVEHFIAHQENADLKYSWDNLFLCCARCNNFKRHHYNRLLNCTDEQTDVLRAIEHVPPLSLGAKIRIIARATDERTLSTAALIDRVFNEDDSGNKKVASIFMKKRVFSEYARLVQHMNSYFDPHTIENDKDRARAHIRHMMREEQEYSAFLRWVAINDPIIYELVSDIIPQPSE
jgi:hypothetical protein